MDELVLSCGIVVVRKDSNKYKYLMLRSYNFWDAGPKGRNELGETDFETALRETEEETGFAPINLNFRWGKISIDTEPYTKLKNKMARFFLAETDIIDITLPISLEIGKPEHDEYRWLNYSQAIKLINPRIKRVLDWAKGKIDDSMAI